MIDKFSKDELSSDADICIDITYKIAKDLSNALKDLIMDGKVVIHKDIKPANVLV